MSFTRGHMDSCLTHGHRSPRIINAKLSLFHAASASIWRLLELARLFRKSFILGSTNVCLVGHRCTIFAYSNWTCHHIPVPICGSLHSPRGRLIFVSSIRQLNGSNGTE